MLDFAERQQNLKELAATPEADPAILHDVVWDVVGDVLYDGSKEYASLLPSTRPVVENLAKHEDLLPESDTRLNAGMLLATWGALSAFAGNRTVPESVRLTNRRRLSALVSATMGGRFDLDNIEPPVAQKISEAVLLQLLQRNGEESGVFGLLAPPYMHHFRGFNETSGTTSFQLYAVAPNRVLPVSVNRFAQDRMQEWDRYRGVLIIALGQVAMSSAKFVGSIMTQSKQRGSIKNGQRWMVNHMAELLALEVQSKPTVIPDNDSHWLDQTTEHVARLVKGFNASTATILRPL